MLLHTALAHPPVTPWPVVWAPAFSAFGVLVIGLITASIAYRQWETARAKLRLDLYDRRLTVYRGCMDAVAAMTRSGQLTAQELSQFSATIREVDFLFDKDVAAFVNKLHDTVWNTAMPVPPLADLPIGLQAIGWRTQSIVWLNVHGQMLKTVFAPYMQLEGKRPKRAKALPMPKAFPPRPYIPAS